MPNESLALRLFISTLSSSKDFRFTEYWQGAQLSVFQLLVWEQPEQRTGADPHRFPPFYGNRSDMFFKSRLSLIGKNFQVEMLLPAYPT